MKKFIKHTAIIDEMEGKDEVVKELLIVMVSQC